MRRATTLGRLSRLGSEWAEVAAVDGSSTERRWGFPSGRKPRGGAATAGPYFIYLSNPGLYLEVQVYADAARTVLEGECDTGADEKACFAQLSAGTHYVDVTRTDVFGGPYPFSIVPVVSEGTESAPVALPLTDVRLTTLPSGGVSYYSFEVVDVGGYEVNTAVLAVSDPSISLSGDPTVEIYTGADFSGSPLSSARGYAEVSGLDPGLYGVRVVAYPDEHIIYRIAAFGGLSEGSWANPVDLTLGVAHTGPLGNGAESYMRFTTGAHAGAYVATFADHPGLVFRLSAYALADPSTGVSACTVQGDGCTLSGLEANTTYCLVADLGLGPYTFQIDAGTSEGTAAHPVQLTQGVTDSSTLDYAGKAYYAFTIPTGGAYVLDALAPDTSYVITLIERIGASGPTTMHLFDLDVTMGCELGATTCFDFETGTTPASFVEPPESDAPWVVSGAAAATGAFGYGVFVSGGDAVSCFEVTIPGDSWVVALSADLASAVVSDDLVVYVDGTQEQVMATDSLGFRRRVVAVPKGAGHVWAWCWSEGVSMSSPSYAVDDIQIE